MTQQKPKYEPIDPSVLGASDRTIEFRAFDTPTLPPQQQQQHIHIDSGHMAQAQQAEAPLFGGPVDWAALMCSANTDYEQIMTLHSFDAAWRSEHAEAFPDQCPPEQAQEILCKSKVWVAQSRNILNDSRLVEAIHKGWLNRSKALFMLTMESRDRTEFLQDMRQAANSHDREQVFLRACVAMDAKKSRLQEAERHARKDRSYKEARALQNAVGSVVQVAIDNAYRYPGSKIEVRSGNLTVQTEDGKKFNFGVEVEVNAVDNPGHAWWEALFGWSQQAHGCTVEVTQPTQHIIDHQHPPTPGGWVNAAAGEWLSAYGIKPTEHVPGVLGREAMYAAQQEAKTPGGTCDKCGHEIKERQLLSGSYVGCMC